MLLSLCDDILVSVLLLLLLLVAVLSVEVPSVDLWGGLQAPMAANKITIAKKMFFINFVFNTATTSIPLPPGTPYTGKRFRFNQSRNNNAW